MESTRIHFTKHAVDKFAVLARHSVHVSKKKVAATVREPDLVDYSRVPLLIAQSNLDKTRVLRVVYRKERNTRIIITFYPGRKSQYEKK